MDLLNLKSKTTICLEQFKRLIEKSVMQHLVRGTGFITMLICMIFIYLPFFLVRIYLKIEIDRLIAIE